MACLTGCLFEVSILLALIRRGSLDKTEYWHGMELTLQVCFFFEENSIFIHAFERNAGMPLDSKAVTRL